MRNSLPLTSPDVTAVTHSEMMALCYPQKKRIGNDAFSVYQDRSVLVAPVFRRGIPSR